MEDTKLIGADWGTSNLRVFRLSKDGRVLETREAPTGVGALSSFSFKADASAANPFETALAALTKDWLARLPAVPILLCGMVGSRQGWIEVPYLPCPADLSAIANALSPVQTRLGSVWIVPGLVTQAGSGTRDVMRGEETQILGTTSATASGLVIAPGTHSKWATVENGCITDFRTYMTGEVFAVLSAHSILGRLMRSTENDATAFDAGVSRSLEDADLLHLLFSARTEGLFERIAPDALSSYLSGLLIGAEIRAGLAQRPSASITLIASARIADLYQRALGLAGIANARLIDGGVASVQGLWQIGSKIAEPRNTP